MLGCWRSLSLRVLWGIVLAWWLPGKALAQQPAGPSRVAVRAARLFDGKNAKLLTDAVVLVEANRIKAVGSKLAIPEGTQVIDLGDVTLLPGLIDVHSHLLMRDDITVGPNNLEVNVARLSTAERALLGVKQGREMLDAGFTMVRDVGNSGVNGDVALRNAIQKGWVEGPRISACTRALAPHGGQFGRLQPGAQGLIEQEYVTIAGADEARRAVRQAVYDGADCIKVIGDNGFNVLSEEELKVIVEEAHRVKRPVAVHTTKDESIRAAVAAGVDSIEHGYSLPEDVLAPMARKRIFLVPTYGSVELCESLDSMPGDEAMKRMRKERCRKAIEQGQAQLRRAVAAGVRVAVGSDSYTELPGKTRGDSTLAYLLAYGEAGLPAVDVLRAATSSAAELLRVQDRLGSLEAGRLADVIAVKGDPLKDLSALRQVRFVMKDGKVVVTPVEEARQVSAPAY